MNIMNLKLQCWSCGKEYEDKEIGYDFKNPKYIGCKCGGTIVSNSGKIMAGIKKNFEVTYTDSRPKYNAIFTEPTASYDLEGYDSADLGKDISLKLNEAILDNLEDGIFSSASCTSSTYEPKIDYEELNRICKEISDWNKSVEEFLDQFEYIHRNIPFKCDPEILEFQDSKILLLSHEDYEKFGNHIAKHKSNKLPEFKFDYD